MDFLLEIIMFLLKTIIIVGIIALPIILLVLIIKNKDEDEEASGDEGQISLKNLKLEAEKRSKKLKKFLKEQDPKELLKERDPNFKKKKENAKEKAKSDYDNEVKERLAYLNSLDEQSERGKFCPQNVYVINFKGSTRGSEVKRLRREIDAVLDIATDKDEVIVNLDSPGGMVNSYGLCASQLVRIKDRGIRLVCCVDAVAASGGYLMACVADEIVAAPFAYIGSIGVIASIPNFNKVLKKHDVEYEQMTAGKYKRTLTLFGENTDEARAKFKEELSAIHERFKDQVLKYRKSIKIDEIATGEHWLALDAKERGLVDTIMTSDEYIAKRSLETYNLVVKVAYKPKKDTSLKGKLRNLISLKSFRKLNNDLLDKVDSSEFMHIK